MYERYCKLRDSRGLKDADVAAGTGINKSAFSDWKSGRSIPKKPRLQKIADYFGVPLDYFITEKYNFLSDKDLLQMEIEKSLNDAITKSLEKFGLEETIQRTKMLEDVLTNYLLNEDTKNE